VRETLNEGSWWLTESEGDEKQREIRQKIDETEKRSANWNGDIMKWLESAERESAKQAVVKHSQKKENHACRRSSIIRRQSNRDGDNQ
jgi:hypothetical protein